MCDKRLISLNPPLQPQGAISWADLYKLDPSGMWSYDVHFSQTNGFPDFILSRDCWNSCDPGLANISYCKLDQELANCCVEAGIEKYKDELWLQIVAKQTNNSAGANNTNDPLTKVQSWRLLVIPHGCSSFCLLISLETFISQCT